MRLAFDAVAAAPGLVEPARFASAVDDLPLIGERDDEHGGERLELRIDPPGGAGGMRVTFLLTPAGAPAL